MNIEKQKVFLAMFRTLCVLFGALGSSIIGWVLVNHPTPILKVLAWSAGGVFSGVSVVLIVVYFLVAVKLWAM